MALLNGAVYNKQAFNQTSYQAIQAVFSGSASASASLANRVVIPIPSTSLKGSLNSTPYNGLAFNQILLAPAQGSMVGAGNMSATLARFTPPLVSIFINDVGYPGIFNSVPFNTVELNSTRQGKSIAGVSSMSTTLVDIVAMSVSMGGTSVMNGSSAIAATNGTGFNSLPYMAIPYNDGLQSQTGIILGGSIVFISSINGSSTMTGSLSDSDVLTVTMDGSSSLNVLLGGGVFMSGEADGVSSMSALFSDSELFSVEADGISLVQASLVNSIIVSTRMDSVAAVTVQPGNTTYTAVTIFGNGNMGTILGTAGVFMNAVIMGSSALNSSLVVTEYMSVNIPGAVSIMAKVVFVQSIAASINSVAAVGLPWITVFNPFANLSGGGNTPIHNSPLNSYLKKI